MFIVDTFQERDLLPILRIASRALPEDHPYEFYLQMAREQGRYFRVARAVKTGRAVGFIVAGREPGLQGNILLFAVDPAYQGTGLGRMLLRDVQRQLALDDVRAIRLEVRTDNDRALAFYRREGFAVDGLQERAYKDGSDAFKMMKPLL